MERDEWWRLLPGPVRRLPADLAAVVVMVVLTNLAIVLPVIKDSPLRVLVGLPFVLFLPGYAFIAALFPEAGESPVDAETAGAGGESSDGGESGGGDTGASQSRIDEANPAIDDTDAEGMLDRREGIDGIERVALAFGLSIAIVPLIGLVLNFTPWGIRLAPILVSVSLFTLGSVVVAARRRWDLPEEERFRVPYREWIAAGRSELFEPDSRTDAALNVLLALSIVLALASVSYAVAVPKQGETFTEFYLLTEDEDGELVADNYPTEFVRGESKPIVIGIGNQEHEETRYEVVTQLQRVAVANNSTTVLERESLDRVSVTLAHNETWHHNQTLSPGMTGEDLRLVFLLYRDSVPAEPTVANSYRETHLWVNVSASG